MKSIETKYNFYEILYNFKISTNIKTLKAFGSGHINDTYFIANQNVGGKDYLLQRINHHVFKDVPALIENIQRVTAHLRKKLLDIPSSNPDKEVLMLIETKDGKYFYKDEEGNFWRMYYYLANTKSYDIVETEQQAFEGGKAFGKFQSLLSDLDANLIADTIPGFHNIEKRLASFLSSIAENPANRVKKVLPEIEFVEQRIEAMSSILRLGNEGKIQKRIIHSDTKFSNVLLDLNDKAQCVVDLDTVMPGYVAYDFGDAMRTLVNTAAEDEPDLEKIQVNIPLFQAYTKGYLEETKSFITEKEVKTLFSGVLLLPYMQAVRFLTDYIDGDNYYKIHFEGHNLQRTRAQIQLLKKLEENSETLEQIIKKEAAVHQLVL